MLLKPMPTEYFLFMPMRDRRWSNDAAAEVTTRSLYVESPTTLRQITSARAVRKIVTLYQCAKCTVVD